MNIPGPGVYLTAAECAVLLRDLRWRGVNLEAMRSEARLRDPGYAKVLMDLHSAALAYEERVRAAGSNQPGTNPVPPLERGASLNVEKVTATSAAVLSGCSSRAVRKAAAERRLAGELVDGTWWFDPVDVQLWCSRRAA